MEKSEAVAARMAKYNWSEKTLSVFGIGGVSSHAAYIQKMEAAGYSRAFLHEIALSDTRIFSPHCLIFAVKDEHGQTIAFSARNLFYEQAIAEATAAQEKYGIDSKEAKDMREAIPAKFVNSIQVDPKTQAIRNPIYHKARRLFGIHTLKQTRSLFVFEGNADVVTAFNAGLTNTAGICGKAGHARSGRPIVDLRARQAGCQGGRAAFRTGTDRTRQDVTFP